MKFIDMILGVLAAKFSTQPASVLRRRARQIAFDPRNQAMAAQIAERRRLNRLRQCQQQAYAAKAALVRAGKGRNTVQGIPLAHREFLGLA